MIEVNIKKLSDNAIIPTKGSEFAAGWDLYGANVEEITIQPHETVKIPTDLAMEIPVNYAGLIYARSGIATKNGLAPANKVAVIDSDYRGNIIVALHNHSDIPQTIGAKERIAQIVITPFLPITFNVKEELDTTKRGESGFGGSGRF